MTQRAQVLIPLLLCFLSTLADAAQEKLAEVVKRQRGPIEGHIEREFSPVDLPELVKSCDLIARVVVLDGRSLLSKDGTSIQSEFTVQILDRFFSARILTPGEKIVITKPGGTMTIEGYPVTIREADFPPLEANEEYVLFLRFDPSTSRYVVPYGAQGAFRNMGGIVEQVSKDTGIWNREGSRGRVPIVEFTQELTRALNLR